MYIKIDNTFLIKDEINNKDLDKCISFIANQKNVKKFEIEKVYQKKKIFNLNLPIKILKKKFDVIVASKFYNDLKFIDFKKDEIFYLSDNKSRLLLDKIDKYKLKDIIFFPPTYINDNLIYQKLSKGKFYRPNNFSESEEGLLNKIAETIKTLSSLNGKTLKLQNYLNDINLENILDKLNEKIINISILKLEKSYNKNIKVALTHGDFKFEHLFFLEEKIEFIIDWEDVDVRSVFFDLFNFFIPWFVRRSYNYSKIKIFISKFIENRLPHLKIYIKGNFEIYFCLFVIERYLRIKNARSLELNKDKAYKRFNLIFNDLIYEMDNLY